MKIKSDSLEMEGDYHHHNTAPQGKDIGVMNVEAVVDATQQKLKELRPFHSATKQVPTTLIPEAQIVMQSLFACFTRQHAVQEGIVNDLIWGFAQAGIPAECTRVGLRALAKDGYIKFQGPDNSDVSVDADKIDQCWVRYQKKLSDLVYE